MWDLFNGSEQWKVEATCVWPALSLVLLAGACMLAMWGGREELSAAGESPWTLWGGTLQDKPFVSVAGDHWKPPGVSGLSLWLWIWGRPVADGHYPWAVWHSGYCEPLSNAGSTVPSAGECKRTKSKGTALHLSTVLPISCTELDLSSSAVVKDDRATTT